MWKWRLHGKTALELLFGTALVRVRLEVRKRDHEAGGGNAGEERDDEVEKEGESHRAEELHAGTQPADVLGGSHSQSSTCADIKLTSKPVYLLLNLYPSS